MTSLIHTISPGVAHIGLWLRAVIRQEVANMRTGLIRRAAYKRNYCALNSLSESDLAAEGLTRCDIQATAHAQAMQ